MGILGVRACLFVWVGYGIEAAPEFLAGDLGPECWVCHQCRISFGLVLSSAGLCPVKGWNEALLLV